MEHLSIKKIAKKQFNNHKLEKADRKAQDTILRFRKHPKFSADKADFVRFSAYLMAEKDSDMCIFYADGDNIRIANEMADLKAVEINEQMAKEQNLPNATFLKHPITGEEIVDKDIESILLQIRQINQNYGYEDALIGITGDEITVVIPHVKQEDKARIWEEYSRAQSGLITISVGYTDDLSKGVCEALRIAEENSQKQKSKKKIRNHKKAFQENSTEILAEELRAMLAQLRIRVQSLSKEQKSTLKRNIASAFETSIRTKEGIGEDVKELIFSVEEKDFLRQRVEDLEERVKTVYSSEMTAKQRENYILSQILTKTPVDSIEKLDYFLDRHSREYEQMDKKTAFRKLSKQALVNIEFSGIKDVNDTYGHTECDKRVYQDISAIQRMVDEIGFRRKTPIFAYNISSYGFFIPEGDQKYMEQLAQQILVFDSEFKIAATSIGLGENLEEYTIQALMEDEEFSSGDFVKFLLDHASSINVEVNRNILSTKKINDKMSIIRYISRNLKRITKSLGRELDEETIDLALNQVLEMESQGEGTEPKAQTADRVFAESANRKERE